MLILYVKDDPYGATVPAYEFPIEYILAVEHDVIPLDGVEVFQRIEIDAIGDRVALAEAEQISRRLRISRTSVPRFLSPRLYAEAPQRPDELWAADITYVPTQKKRRIARRPESIMFQIAVGSFLTIFCGI